MTHKTLQIIINGQSTEWNNTKISFKEVVKIAFPQVQESEIKNYTMTYENGPKQNPQGNMHNGDKVHVKNNMIFLCTITSES